MEPGAQPTPCLEGKTTSVSFPNGRILHARPPSYRGTTPSLKKLRHQFSTGYLSTEPSLEVALLVAQRTLHLTLGLTEILWISPLASSVRPFTCSLASPVALPRSPRNSRSVPSILPFISISRPLLLIVIHSPA